MGRIIGGGEGEIRKNEREEKEFMNERVRGVANKRKRGKLRLRI